MKSACAFTLGCDDSPWLKVWARYYGEQLGAENTFLAWHALSAQSRPPAWWPNQGERFIQRHPYVADEPFLQRFAEATIAELLKSYQTVIFAGWDEYLVPDPALYIGGLAEYLDVTPGPFLAGTGFDLLQKTNERDLDFSRPILPQRFRWVPSRYYSKICVFREPVRIRLSCKKLKGRESPKSDHGLSIIHTKLSDMAECSRFNAFLLAQPQPKVHYRLTVPTREELERAIRTAKRGGLRSSKKIPERYRNSF